MRRLRRKEKDGDIKNNKAGKKNKTTVLLYLKQIPPRSQKINKRNNMTALEKTFWRSTITTVIRMATTL